MRGWILLHLRIFSGYINRIMYFIFVLWIFSYIQVFVRNSKELVLINFYL